jgi:hypothetical protein
MQAFAASIRAFSAEVRVRAMITSMQCVFSHVKFKAQGGDCLKSKKRVWAIWFGPLLAYSFNVRGKLDNFIVKEILTHPA